MKAPPSFAQAVQRQPADYQEASPIYTSVASACAATDEERHMGAAELEFEPDNLEAADGIYWTRRNWKTGLNTAGRLELRRVALRKEKGKSLRDYATEEKNRLLS